jgi:hypothetical protein
MMFGGQEVDEDDAESDEDMGFGLVGLDASASHAFTPSVESVARLGYELAKSGPAFKPMMASMQTRSSMQSLSSAAPPSPKPERSGKQLDPLQTLIELQTFEGYWSLDEKLCRAIGTKIETASQTAQRQGVDAKVVATALAVHFLTTKLKNEEESWELVVEKAKGWLEMNGCDEGSAVWKVVAGLV